MEETESSTGHLFLPNQVSSTEFGLHLIQWLATATPRESANSEGCSQDYRFLCINLQQVPTVEENTHTTH